MTSSGPSGDPRASSSWVAFQKLMAELRKQDVTRHEQAQLILRWMSEHLNLIRHMAGRVERLTDHVRKLQAQKEAAELQRDRAEQALRDHRCHPTPTPSPTPTPPQEGRTPMSQDSFVHFAVDKFIEGAIWVLSQSLFYILVLLVCLMAAGRYEWFSQGWWWLLGGIVCMTALGAIPLCRVRKGLPVLSIFPVAPSDYEQARNEGSRSDCNWEVPINKRQVQSSWTVYIIFVIWIICTMVSMGNNPYWIFIGFLIIITGAFWLPCWLKDFDGADPDKTAFTNALDELHRLPNDDDRARAPHVEEANRQWWRRWYKDDSSWRIRFCEIRAVAFLVLAMMIPLWGGLRIPAMLVNEMHLRGYHTAAGYVSWIAPPEDRSQVIVRDYETIIKNAPGHPYADDNGNVRCLRVYVNDHEGQRPVIEIAPIESRTTAQNRSGD